MIKNKQPKQAEIRKKLAQSNISKPEEYEEIISNLIGQRQRLEMDLKLLREKVVALQEKQAQRQLTKTMPRKISTNKKPVNYREELNKKYEELKIWQKRSLKAMKSTTLQVEYRNYLDRLFSMQQEIQATLRQLNDEYDINKRLRKALRVIQKDDKINHNAQQGIEHENQLLKKRVNSLKKIVDRQLTKQIELHDYLIDVKQKDRQIRARERQQRELISRQRRPSRSIKNLKEVRKMKTQGIKDERISQPSQQSQEIIDLTINPFQISSQDEIYQIQGRISRIQNKFRGQVSQIQHRVKRNYPNQALNQKRQGSKLTFGKQFEIILQKVKTSMNLFSQLNKNKIKLYFSIIDSHEHDYNFPNQKKSQQYLLKNLQYDGYVYKKFATQAPIQQQKKQSPLKRSRKYSTGLVNKQKEQSQETKQNCRNFSIQTQDKIQYRLRRDFLGVFEESQFFYDRKILKGQKYSSIRSLQIYYSDRGIAGLKATYNIHNSKSPIVPGQLLLPDDFIKNYCKIHLIETGDDDFIRYFKVRYHKDEKRITQIKIVTNRNIKNGWGDSKIKNQEQIDRDEDIDKDLVFDINQDQYPVSIFCSHIQKGPYWYLSGFGVEIDDL